MTWRLSLAGALIGILGGIGSLVKTFVHGRPASDARSCCRTGTACSRSRSARPAASSDLAHAAALAFGDILLLSGLRLIEVPDWTLVVGLVAGLAGLRCGSSLGASRGGASQNSRRLRP